jgi:hypothetical protein
MKTLAIQLGVPAWAIRTEAHSRTTAESAVEVRQRFSGLRRVVILLPVKTWGPATEYIMADN